MKIFLSILTCFFISASCFADCMGSGISAWPQTDTISENPVIYIEGYLDDQSTVRKIGKEIAIYLTSNNHVVRLDVVEILEGQFRLTQIILKASQRLHPNEVYELYFTTRPKDTGVLPQKINLNVSKKWTVKAENDSKHPSFSSSPKWTESISHQYGCGPIQAINFDYMTAEKGVILVKTVVTNLKDHSENTFYIPSIDGKLSIGHGMCSGPFFFTVNLTYKFEFRLIDASWNEGESATCFVQYQP